jgi:hypothetical protein
MLVLTLEQTEKETLFYHKSFALEKTRIMEEQEEIIVFSYL